MTDHAEFGSLELAEEPWAAHDDTVAATGFFAMARELPGLCAQIVREVWAISRIDTAVMVGLTLAAELFTAVGLLATTGILEQLLTTGPTPERVRAATPALILVVGSLMARTALREGASWASQRLSPQIERVTLTWLLDLTTQVELVAFDDGPFHDRLHRVRDVAVYAVNRLLHTTLEILSSVIGLIAVAGVLTVLHPALLPLLVIAVIPAW